MYMIVFVTTKDKTEAERISQELLNKNLAACVNIVESVDSHFRWQGQMNRASESLMIIKSKKELFCLIEAAVKRLHSYDVPEIIAFDVTAGSAEYLTWVKDQCQHKEDE